MTPLALSVYNLTKRFGFPARCRRPHAEVPTGVVAGFGSSVPNGAVKTSVRWQCSSTSCAVAGNRFVLGYPLDDPRVTCLTRRADRDAGVLILP